jgi:ectoine hydroxylase
MNRRCLRYQLTDDERVFFDKNGYLMIEDALSKGKTRELLKATDRLDAKERKAGRAEKSGRVHSREFLESDIAFANLVTHPRTFPKVWDILGWNIHLYLAHLDVTPPDPPDSERGMGLSWHQDSGRVNQEMETSPRPRLSIKVAYFLSDTSVPGRGNFHVIPGSQKKNKIRFPNGNRNQLLKGSQVILAPKGSAVIFDRRLWHSASANQWNQPRKALFYGYSYRWLMPRGPCKVKKFWKVLDPVQKQICRQPPSDIHGYTSPRDEDVPLKGWIESNLGKEALRP